MLNGTVKMHAHVFNAAQKPSLFSESCCFRKKLFIDTLHWPLAEYNGEERDEFDTENASHCALIVAGKVVGYFRAIPTTRPYLSQSVFNHLATQYSFPNHPDYWEISRFGILPDYRYLSLILYALLFHFAISHDAKALVALVDERHERQLQKIGLVLKRYGNLQSVGESLNGTALYAVAGEIPMTEQNFGKLRELIRLTQHMEVIDDTFIFRSGRFSA